MVQKYFITLVIQLCYENAVRKFQEHQMDLKFNETPQLLFYADDATCYVLMMQPILFSNRTGGTLATDSKCNVECILHFDDRVLSNCFLDWFGHWWFWLPYFPDLNPCSYFLQGFMKDS